MGNNTVKSDQFDLVIVGGGITGAGVARDATLRGMRVALFEKGDYGSGTSSKSSKMIHGGLRYLEHGELGLVFESVSERSVQTKMAPHIVRPQPFLVPIYEDNKPGLEMVNIGLWIYDTLAMFRSPKLHKTFRGKKAADLVPCLETEGLTGAIEYYDCCTDDSRLVLENIIAARDKGADCRSHTEVVRLSRDENGRVTGVTVRDVFTGEESTVKTRALIVAAGAWTDEFVDRVEIDMGRKLLRRTKGVHIVFPADKVPIKRAMSMLSSVDGRVMFAIPWRGRLVIGTTDTDFQGTADEVHADADDVLYLCKSANRYFPSANFQPSDVLSTWAGLRPLIAQEDVEEESDVSREHEIFVRDDGIILIAGGKLTTYRRMAKEVARKAVDWLEENDGGFDKKLRKPRTKKRPLPGGVGLEEQSEDGVRKLARKLTEEHQIDAEVASHLTDVYGARAGKLVALIDEDEDLGLHLNPDTPYVWAEVHFACTEDLAQTVDDVLSRRVPLLLVGNNQGLDVVDRVAEILAEKLGWTDERKAVEIERYKKTVSDSRLFRAG